MGNKRPFCVFTIVRNEPFFLPLWCHYYAKNFGEENLYVLDNSSDDSSVVSVKQRWPRINIKSVPSDAAFAWKWTTDVIKSFQCAALNAPDVVIYSDADEFLIPNNDFADLKSYCEQFAASSKQSARAVGWAVIHQIDTEPPVDVTSFSVLNQRNHIWRAPMYDKTLIAKVPLNWAKGLHTTYDDVGNKLSNDPRDERLALVHLRDIDVDVLYKRSIDRQRMVRFKDQYGCHSTFHGSTDVAQLHEFFRTRHAPWTAFGTMEYEGDSQNVPEHWRHAFS